ncbi:iron ABC transporter ATP-binding protein FetA, partial [Enterobacter sp. CER55]
LDDVNKRNVNEIIHRYAREQNIAVLWVTHDASEITHADDVITLQPHGGKMQEANRG